MIVPQKGSFIDISALRHLIQSLPLIPVPKPKLLCPGVGDEAVPSVPWLFDVAQELFHSFTRDLQTTVSLPVGCVLVPYVSFTRFKVGITLSSWGESAKEIPHRQG